MKIEIKPHEDIVKKVLGLIECEIGNREPSREEIETMIGKIAHLVIETATLKIEE